MKHNESFSHFNTIENDIDKTIFGAKFNSIKYPINIYFLFEEPLALSRNKIILRNKKQFENKFTTLKEKSKSVNAYHSTIDLINSNNTHSNMQNIIIPNNKYQKKSKINLIPLISSPISKPKK